MAYTGTPRTWVSGETVTAALMNSDVRDPLTALAAAWDTSWTPTLTASTSNPTLGSGSTQIGHFIQVGKLVVAHFRIKFGTSGTAAGSGTYYISLPVAPSATWSNRLVGTGDLAHSTAEQPVVMRVDGSNTQVYMAFPATWPAGTASNVSHINLWAWGASDVIDGQVMYEAA